MPIVLSPNLLAGSGLKAIGGGAFGAAATGGGKGVFALLGFGGPAGAIASVGLIAFQLLLNNIFKPKLEPLPIKVTNYSGGTEEAIDIFGERRVDLEWIYISTLPGAAYRANHIRLVACISEGPCEDVTKIWLNEDDFRFVKDATDSNFLIPVAGSDYVLPPDDVSDYAFPQDYALQFRLKFNADGTEWGSAVTTDNPRWKVLPNFRFNYNPGVNDYGRTQTNNSDKYRILIPDDLPVIIRDEYELDETVDPIVWRNKNDPSLTEPVQYTRNRFFGPYDIGLLVKPIDSDFRLTGISGVQVDRFQPFYQQTDAGKRLFKELPNLAMLVKGRKILIPGGTQPVWTDNPIAILHHYDVNYRGIPESKIDMASYQEAYNDCEETITYRYGQTDPDDSDGNDNEFYVKANNTLWQKSSGTWSNLGSIQGDYSWFASKGTNGVYNLKKYSCNLKRIYGENSDDFYRKILVCCAGTRFDDSGKIHYRVGKDRASTLTCFENDILEFEALQTWQSLETRINELIAKMEQSEQNDYLPDTVPFEDMQARARDNEARSKEFVLDGVTNPVQAANLTSILLKQMRSFVVYRFRIGYFDDMIQMGLKVYDVITINNAEHGLVNKKVIILDLEKLSDGTVIVDGQEYDESTFNPILVLPDLPQRNLRFEVNQPPDPPTGLETDEVAHASRAGVQIRLDVGVDFSETASFEFQHKLDGRCIQFLSHKDREIHNPMAQDEKFETFFGSNKDRELHFPFRDFPSFKDLISSNKDRELSFPFDVGGVIDWRDSTPLLESGLLFKAIDLKVFYGARSGDSTGQETSSDYTSSPGRTEGYQLYNTFINADTSLNQPTPDTAILGTNLKFDILGTDSRGSGGSSRARLVVDFARADTNDDRDDLTSLQRNNFRFVFVNNASDGARVMTIPVSDMQEPYVWPNDFTDNGLRNFLRAAYRASPRQTIDFYVLDNRADYLDYRHHGFTGRTVVYNSNKDRELHFALSARAGRFSLNDTSVITNFARGIMHRSSNQRFTYQSNRASDLAGRPIWPIYFGAGFPFSVGVRPAVYLSATTIAYLNDIFFRTTETRSARSVDEIRINFYTDGQDRSGENPAGRNATGFPLTQTQANSMTLVFMRTDGSAIVLGTSNCTITATAGGPTRRVGAQTFFNPGRATFVPTGNVLRAELGLYLFQYRAQHRFRQGSRQTIQGGNAQFNFLIVDATNNRIDLTGNPTVR